MLRRRSSLVSARSISLAKLTALSLFPTVYSSVDFFPCSNLPRRHYWPWRSSHSQIIFDDSLVVVFTAWGSYVQSNECWRPTLLLLLWTLWSSVGSITVTQCSLAYTTYTCGSSNEFSTLQLDWSFASGSTTASLPPYVFNSLHNLAPNYLSTMCQLVAENPSRLHLRSAARGDLAVPATRTIRLYGPHSFAVAGSSTWNSLPASLRNCHLPSSFRRELKTELFARAYFY